MSSRWAALVFAAGLAMASCSEKRTPPKSQFNKEIREHESQPREDEIAEDCVAFARATKAVPTQSTDCPGCSGPGSELLAFRQMHLDRISCSATTCEASVTLRAVFNPGATGTISGGLTAWIPPAQKQEYLNGHAPDGEQVYRVKITYRRNGETWRAIEFDRTD